MSVADAIPFDHKSQRSLERLWLSATQAHLAPTGVRSLVRESWQRSMGADIRPDLPAAPVVWDESQLLTEVERSDWLGVAREAVTRQAASFGGVGHILTLFDHEARMLAAEGDPAALEGLGEMNFRPGGQWSEVAVGTNGPGTALATGLATHIVGAEHFCERLHRWHCAAVPVRDPATGDILGVLDISGFREFAHPHTLNLALALVVAIEKTLTARELERRYLTLSRLTELTVRYPGDAALALDRAGRVLCASPTVPPVFGASSGSSALRAAVADLIQNTNGPGPRDVTLPGIEGRPRRAVWYPVFDGHAPVGGCLLLERHALPSTRVNGMSSRHSSTRYTFRDIRGESAAIAVARDTAVAAARTDLPVLLLGESGTGKEIFAQAIHAGSDRREGPFVAVNCAALPRELIESELFGYEGGAFSGARREGSTGKFEAADGGTIFLDEVVEMPATAQAALLRALQEGEITRLGSNRARPVNVRVIAATNRDLAAALATGSLRTDLYHRLNVLPIELPPLRARYGDVTRLAGPFFESAAYDLGVTGVSVDEDVFHALEGYQWPGNVRELKNLIRRLVAVAGSTIRLADLPLAIRSPGAGADAALEPPAPAGHSRIDHEDAHLMAVVNSSATMAEAAARLGITRSTLYRRMARYGMTQRRVVDRR